MEIKRNKRWAVFYFGMGNSPSLAITFDTPEAAEQYVESQLKLSHKQYPTTYMILESLFFSKG
jgi:hypothetical protein